VTGVRDERLAPVVLVMGKGGVGKSTVAAGLAALEAQVRGAAVLVEFGTGESGARALTGCPGVEHVVVDDAKAVRRASAPLFGSTVLAKLALDNFAMRPLVRAAPGVREIALLEAVRRTHARRPDVRVVVDMPSTGHGVAWLRAPRQGRDFLGEGPLFELCDRLARELVAPGRISVLVVTLPERLVIEETLELCASIGEETALEVDRIVVNRVPRALPPEALRDARALASRPGPHAAVAAALAEVLAAREESGAAARSALDELVRHRRRSWRLPLAATGPSAVRTAEWLRAEGAA
jgi:hypothetical protein